jgi:CRP-like cAMP-binding protein
MRRQTEILVGEIHGPEKADPEHLGSNRMLAALAGDGFSMIAPHIDEVQLARGSVIHEAGDPIDYVYFIHDGIVSQLAAMAEGQSIEVAAIGREGAIGAMAGLGSRRALGRTVVQLPVRAARVPAATLAELVRGSESIRDMIVRYGDVLMAHVQQMAACNALHDVHARLSRWFLHAEDRYGSTLPVTQELLSQLLGVQRTTVTMVCRTMQMDEVIHIGRGVVEIRNSWALQKKACSCYHVMRAATECMLDDVRCASAGARDARDRLMTEHAPVTFDRDML